MRVSRGLGLGFGLGFGLGLGLAVMLFSVFSIACVLIPQLGLGLG